MLISEFFKFNRKRMRSFANIAIKSPINETQQKKGFWHYFQGVVDDFVENATIPGLDRIFKSNVCLLKRCLWTCGFIFAILIFSYISSVIANFQKTIPMITVVATTHYPIFRIPFPEISICNKNRLNWQRYEAAKEKFLKSQHQTWENEEIFLEVLNAYDTLSFGKFNKFEKLTKMNTSQLEILNYINFTLVVEFMAWRCYEIFSECKWVNQDLNCCDIFFKRNSQMGSCLAFNTIESEEAKKKQRSDIFWPWRTKEMGIDYGLRVKVHVNEKLHSNRSTNAKGVLFMITEPSVWYWVPVEVNTHTRNTVSFSAILHYFDKYTRFYSSDIRRCVFEDELQSMFYKSLHGHVYMFENCQAECEQEHQMRYCNCSMDLFYPPGPYRACKVSDLPCLYKYNQKFQYFAQIGEMDFVHDKQSDAMDCTCYANCKSLTYIPNAHSSHLSNVKMDLNNTFVDFSFYFRTNEILVFKTTVKYTWMDLMSGFGGLAGLCIGCSLISIIELLYFFLVDIPKHCLLYYRTQKYLALHRKSQDIKMQLLKDVFIWTK